MGYDTRYHSLYHPSWPNCAKAHWLHRFCHGIHFSTRVSMWILLYLHLTCFHPLDPTCWHGIIIWWAPGTMHIAIQNLFSFIYLLSIHNISLWFLFIFHRSPTLILLLNFLLLGRFGISIWNHKLLLLIKILKIFLLLHTIWTLTLHLLCQLFPLLLQLHLLVAYSRYMVLNSL